MSSCCSPTSDRGSRKKLATVALAGNPNSGKTTIFNALTGLRQKVANYPGVTVEKKTGQCKLPDGTRVDVIDLPGTYSLISRSPDEHVAMEVLRGLREDTPAPDVVVVVVDASNLQRNLYLVSQLIELGRPMVVALNMTDIAERRGQPIDAAKLQELLGVPVVPVVGHKGTGISNLKFEISNARVAPMPDWPLPDAMKEELMLVGGGLAILDSNPKSEIRNPNQILSPKFEIQDAPVEPRAWICRDDADRHLDRYQAIAERLLIGDRAPDIEPVAQREPVASLLHSAKDRLHQLGIDPMQADVEAHYRWIERVASQSITGFQPVPAEQHGLETRDTHVLSYAPSPNLSDRVDRILLHKVWGLAIFAVIMATLFVSIFWLAQPIMDALQNGVSALGGLASSRLPDGPVKDLITDGIFAGVGAVIVFVPQIALLFLFLSILEDSGYLARAAFLMDRLLAKVGLHGKSFIPLLSSFACAIPGIMATRTIENRKARIATIFIAPFMSCSARLPVYALLIGAFFASFSSIARGGILLACYGLGILAAVGTAWFFKRTMQQGPAQAFILELPTYKIPQRSQVARAVWTNTKEFLTKAGTIIFCLSVILWALMYYPRLSPQAFDSRMKSRLQVRLSGRELDVAGGLLLSGTLHTPDENLETLKQLNPKYVEREAAAEQLRHSFAGRFGRLIEPAIKPLGYDWKMGVGLVGAFAAREVFVSTMGIVYSVGDAGDDVTDLRSAMRADTYPSGKPVWTPLVATSLLVWFVLAMQCMSTLAVVRRETGTWRWPIAMLVYMNVLAYVVCLAVYQVGRIWFA
jgi:ferrous iron transport protein B